MRTWLWLQLIIGWLPVWALYTTLIATAHRVPLWHAGFNALRAIGVAAVLGLLVQRLTERLPWPRPITPAFAIVHAVAAAAYAVSWVGLTSAIESVPRGRLVITAPAGITSFVILGVWLYLMVAGVSYAMRATERAARAEAIAARSQLAALRSQLNPHFLFNAMHTVVQLIPSDPRRAAQAAERLAGLLRTTIEEDRDLVPLRDERAFVERYLDVERIRFGERLEVEFRVEDDAAELLLPSFALLTLVENAVRHGAAPREAPTRVTITGQVAGERLVLTVHDTGAGADPGKLASSEGTGLRRLRERLHVLYGGNAELSLAGSGEGGFTARVTLPRQADRDA